MARLRVILVLSWICVGCAPRSPPDVSPVDAGDRTLHVLVAEETVRRAIVHTATTAAALAAPERGTAEDWAEPGCRTFVVREDVDAGEVVASWEHGLRDPLGAHAWLLSPVLGTRHTTLGAAGHASGLSAEGGAVVVCTERPVPDWWIRIEHPALRIDGDGLGAFRRNASGETLERVASTSNRQTSVRRIETLAAGPDPSPGVSIDSTHALSIASGREAGSLLANSSADRRVVRARGWDATYALWLDDRARWTNDPKFRRWVAERVDRKGMAGYLFGDHALPVDSLVGSPVSRTPGSSRPFSTTSTPRLELAFDAGDPHASSVASRVKAVLELEGLEVTLRPGAGREVGESLAQGGTAMGLLCHRPPVADPLLGLLDTLWPIAERAPAEIERIDRATRIEAPDRRAERAGEIESVLIADARLVPLVRVHAWIAIPRSVSGVEVGVFGVLDLERAEWSR